MKEAGQGRGLGSDQFLILACKVTEPEEIELPRRRVRRRALHIVHGNLYSRLPAEAQLGLAELPAYIRNNARATLTHHGIRRKGGGAHGGETPPLRWYARAPERLLYDRAPLWSRFTWDRSRGTLDPA